MRERMITIAVASAMLFLVCQPLASAWAADPRPLPSRDGVQRDSAMEPAPATNVTIPVLPTTRSGPLGRGRDNPLRPIGGIRPDGVAPPDQENPVRPVGTRPDGDIRPDQDIRPDTGEDPRKKKCPSKPCPKD